MTYLDWNIYVFVSIHRTMASVKLPKCICLVSLLPRFALPVCQLPPAAASKSLEISYNPAQQIVSTGEPDTIFDWVLRFQSKVGIMTVGTELAPGPNAVDITPTKDGGIMKEIKVLYFEY